MYCCTLLDISNGEYFEPLKFKTKLYNDPMNTNSEIIHKNQYTLKQAISEKLRMGVKIITISLVYLKTFDRGLVPFNENAVLDKIHMCQAIQATIQYKGRFKRVSSFLMR
eukprot:NODE_146_length_15710_cov_0.617385.p7 type:complete len:110 gc:universal NODE_146_length_15710_cov_0.617385:12638-12309(-)